MTCVWAVVSTRRAPTSVNVLQATRFRPMEELAWTSMNVLLENARDTTGYVSILSVTSSVITLNVLRTTSTTVTTKSEFFYLSPSGCGASPTNQFAVGVTAVQKCVKESPSPFVRPDILSTTRGSILRFRRLFRSPHIVHLLLFSPSKVRQLAMPKSNSSWE